MLIIHIEKTLTDSLTGAEAWVWSYYWRQISIM